MMPVAEVASGLESDGAVLVIDSENIRGTGQVLLTKQKVREMHSELGTGVAYAVTAATRFEGELHPVQLNLQRTDSLQISQQVKKKTEHTGSLHDPETPETPLPNPSQPRTRLVLIRPHATTAGNSGASIYQASSSHV